MKKLVIGVATRGRPDELRWVLDTTSKNCTNRNTTIIVHGDSDDASLEGFSHKKAVMDIRPRPDSIAAKWNRMLEEDGDVYMMMVDYRAQVTPGFDQNVLDAASVFPDGVGIVYNHMCNLSFPAYQSITRKVADTLGHFYVEHFPYWFVDHWLDDLAKMIGRFVYATAHTAVVPRPDGGTQEMREPALWASLYDALYQEREDEAEKLLAVMDEPLWRKTQLRKNFELVHQRSLLLNGVVRGMPARVSNVDERYARIRAAAVEKINSTYHRLKDAA